jgi:hypothetical protein
LGKTNKILVMAFFSSLCVRFKYIIGSLFTIAGKFPINVCKLVWPIYSVLPLCPQQIQTRIYIRLGCYSVVQVLTRVYSRLGDYEAIFWSGFNPFVRNQGHGGGGVLWGKNEGWKSRDTVPLETVTLKPLCKIFLLEVSSQI